jgi:hypothetical protein
MFLSTQRFIFNHGNAAKSGLASSSDSSIIGVSSYPSKTLLKTAQTEINMLDEADEHGALWHAPAACLHVPAKTEISSGFQFVLMLSNASWVGEIDSEDFSLFKSSLDPSRATIEIKSFRFAPFDIPILALIEDGALDATISVISGNVSTISSRTLVFSYGS